MGLIKFRVLGHLIFAINPFKFVTVKRYKWTTELSHHRMVHVVQSHYYKMFGHKGSEGRVQHVTQHVIFNTNDQALTKKK